MPIYLRPCHSQARLTHFFGAIPSSFFQQASNLTSFNVSNNTFTGYVPSSICLHSSPSLRLLDFSSNVFNGNLAPGLGKCSKLQVFHASHNNLSGLLPEDIYNATKLEEISLPCNSLHGAISDRIANLTNLAILDLYFNHFGGELPPNLGKLSKLKLVTLDFNNLEGSLPPSLMNCTNLVELRLGSNNLEGDISILDFSRLNQLTKLDLRNNNFTGTVSVSLYSCRGMLFDDDMVDFDGFQNLRFFGLGYCGLTCQIPVWLSKLKNIEILLMEIALPLNSLHGAISDRIANLTNLAILDLYFNQLNGELPHNLGKLSKLKLVTLDFNNLEGSLPQSLINCTNLVELHLLNNNLEGDISMLDFSRLSQLTKLDLRMNKFTGTVPVSLYSCRSLKAIGLSRNHLEGQIQAEIISLKSLSFLCLGNNRFTNLTGAMKILMSCKSLHVLMLDGAFKGEGMPSDDDMVDFDGFQNLRLLSLFNSDLTGQMPVWLSKLKNLEILRLDFNQITGPIPSWLGTLPRLFHIYLSENQFSGEFPKQLCRLPRLVYEPNIASQLDDTSYAFELPIFSSNNFSIFAKQTILQQKMSSVPAMIRLSNNNISGYIPAEIGQLHLLRLLFLDSNTFSGVIPDQISNLKNLEILDLSMNHLSGIIPSSLASLNFLKEFNVSYNNLEGSIPTGTQLQSFEASAFEGNPKLCGAPLPNKCGPNKDMDVYNKNNKDVENVIPWFYIFAASGFIVGFWGSLWFFSY
ncbi:tyrosine-sulfated glycopeptide receptor 1-like [Prunus avium]|uniref:Tyrosine-sulfated glycopeptide receptor 1-like n=1 Tax=Prunus avium TaxID=42229 RepID=A0A6P5U5D0_PRUAV|nr:tyrosine-sulfated glycopeptide receptor 1-like [Prunus avium]